MVSASVALFLAFLVAVASAELPYEGRVLSVVTGFSDIAAILTSHVEEFRNLTGATVVVTVREFGTLFSDTLTDLEQGSPFFDVCVFVSYSLNTFLPFSCDCNSARSA